MITTSSDQDQRMNDLIRKREPLHPDLIPYFDQKTLMLRHPLVHQPFVFEELFALMNAQFLEKKRLAKEARAEADWLKFLALHDPVHQIDAFEEIRSLLDDGEYWELLGWVWSEKEFISNKKTLWLRLLKAKRDHRDQFMTARERNYLRGLPDVLTVYRGFDARNAKGISWTLDRKKAEWFARRFEMLDRTPRLATGTVQKSDVIAYVSRSREKEIIINPRKISNLETKRI